MVNEESACRSMAVFELDEVRMPTPAVGDVTFSVTTLLGRKLMSAPAPLVAKMPVPVALTVIGPAPKFSVALLMRTAVAPLTVSLPCSVKSSPGFKVSPG
ncbi:Uncharacterised protein [Bordetella bronchiseptica]|nr:Uncharacterised protein [Bordetella bronchiseptica]